MRSKTIVSIFSKYSRAFVGRFFSRWQFRTPPQRSNCFIIIVLQSIKSIATAPHAASIKSEARCIIPQIYEHKCGKDKRSMGKNKSDVPLLKLMHKNNHYIWSTKFCAQFVESHCVAIYYDRKINGILEYIQHNWSCAELGKKVAIKLREKFIENYITELHERWLPLHFIILYLRI